MLLSVGRVGSGVGRVGLTSPVKGGLNLAAFMASQADGFWFDAAQTDRLFQDVNGTTPADDTNEPIGLVMNQRLWGGRSLADHIPTVADTLSSKNLTTWSFTNASGSASRTATTLNLRGASDVVFKTGSAVGGTSQLGDVFDAVFAVSGTGNIRIGGLSGTGGPTFQAVTLTGSPTTYRVRYLNLAAGGAAGPVIQGAADGSPADLTLHDVGFFEIADKSGYQTTGTLRPVLQATGAKFDGLDDVLLTGLLCGAGPNFLAGRVTVPASLGGTQVIAGQNGATDTAGRFRLSVTSGGLLRASVCNIDLDGAVDLRGQSPVVGLLANAGTASLIVDGQVVGTAAYTGSPDATVPIRVGARNNNGTSANFWGGSIRNLVAGRQALDDTLIRNLCNAL